MKFKKLIDCGVLIFIGLHVQVQPVDAGTVTFTIDPTRSSIALSGSISNASLGTLPLKQQGAGSLTTTYTGSIMADLTPPYIDFPGGSLILANTNGTWKPAVGGGSGSAPADYGAEIIESEVITAYFADRNLRYDVTSAPAALTNGDFNSGLLVFSDLTNMTPAPGTDYSITIPLEPAHDTNGTLSPSGSTSNAPNSAYLTNTGGQLTLVVPINITNDSMKSAYDIELIRTGTVVATAPASAWPLTLSASVQGGQVTLTWPSFPGPTFTVQTTPTLGTNWTNATGVATVQANTTTWTGPATNTMQFYRINAAF